MADPFVLFLLVAGMVLIGAPFAAYLALARVRVLERHVAALDARVNAAAPAVPVAWPPRPSVGMPTQTVVATAGDAVANVARPLAAAAAGQTPPTGASTEWETIIAGRWFTRIGLVAVTIGVSYLLKYAIDNEWMGPTGQVALGVVLGAGLVAWSAVFVRRGFRDFADGIAGLGAAVLYLSLWAGATYYHVLPTNVGFGAMMLVTAAMMALALGRNSQPLAMIALIGGFAAPWLIGTGRDDLVVLYLALLNAALLAIARARAWRCLELPAFACTQGCFWGWSGPFSADAILVRTALFATLFFAQFSALPVIRARRWAVLHPEQGLLMLVNAAIFLSTLHLLLWPAHRGALTLATLGASAWYVALARLVPARTAEWPARLLLASLALTCATLVMPMRLNGPWITLAWAIEAGVLMWSGVANRRGSLRAVAYGLFTVVAVRLVISPLHATTFLVNVRLATALVVAASAAFAAWVAGRSRESLLDSEPNIVAVLAVGANVLVLWALTMEVDLYFPNTLGGVTPDALLARSLTVSLLWTLYATGLVLTGVRLAAAALRWQGLALFGITTLKVFCVDLAELSGVYRIASSIALGVVLLTVSFLYQQSLAARQQAKEAHQDGPDSVPHGVGEHGERRGATA